MLEDDSHRVMRAADVGLVASGTATLEAAILGMPHVVFYRVSPLTRFLYKILRGCRIITDDMIGLPNLLARRKIVPELLQEEATPPRLAHEILLLLSDPSRQLQMKSDFSAISETLGLGESLDLTAQAILSQAGYDSADLERSGFGSLRRESATSLKI
jgi:lipid-A-disaccharide synthase